MFPWLWFWAPQLYFPWSGGVTQRIEPDTHWFFQGINPGAGDARIEEKIFSVASYGKQLGLIITILIELADRSKTRSPEFTASLGKLKAIAREIEAIKNAEYEFSAEEIERCVRELQSRGGIRYARLASRLRPLLADDRGDKGG